MKSRIIWNYFWTENGSLSDWLHLFSEFASANTKLYIICQGCYQPESGGGACKSKRCNQIPKVIIRCVKKKLLHLLCSATGSRSVDEPSRAWEKMYSLILRNLDCVGIMCTYALFLPANVLRVCSSVIKFDVIPCSGIG